MAEKKENRGRKKSPTIKRLEGTINRLNRELAAATAPKKPGENLNKVAYGVVYNAEKKVYLLHTVVYNPETKEAMVSEEKVIGDFQPRAMLELKKLNVKMIEDSLK